MARPSILVMYNHPTLSEDHPDALAEHSVIDHARHVQDVLAGAGFRASLFSLREDPQLLVAELRRGRPDAVFNLYEGSYLNGETEAFVAGIMEWLRVPFTGSSFQSLSLALSKHLTKQLLVGAGLPTPDFMVVREMPAPRCAIPWPVIVKPARFDASVGLDQGSVVTNQRQLQDRVARVLEEYGSPALVEEFIDGREFNVALMEDPELRPLPPAEIVFEDGYDGWPILTYAAKWHTETDECRLSPPRCPAEIAPRLQGKIEELAMRAFRLLGCRDYARVDFRVRPSGKPMILEVNPNPDISTGAGFDRCLQTLGLDIADFYVSLARRALERDPGISAIPAGSLVAMSS